MTNKANRILLPFTLLFLVSSLPLFADVSETVFPQFNAEQHETLASGEYLLFRSSDPEEGLKALPESSQSRIIREAFREVSPELYLEMVSRIPAPEVPGGDLYPYLYNQLRAVSTQEGILYHSYRRQKWYPLITESYFIKGKNNKTPVPDPVVQQPEPVESRYVLQKDTTFGTNIYRYTYLTDGKTILMDVENETDMRVLLFFKALEERELNINVLVVPQEESIFVYALAYIENPPQIDNVLGYPVNIPDSFRKRVQAVLKWYGERLGVKKEEGDQ